MSHKTQTRRRWALVPLALTLMLAVLAVPAAAKGPVPIPYGCASATGEGSGSDRLRAPCERETVSARQGFDGEDARVIAGSVAVVVLMMAGGMLALTRRQDAERTRPAALS
jgi:hypothetical protein